jgi:flagellar motor switch/type III secretory pathway protein FliN
MRAVREALRGRCDPSLLARAASEVMGEPVRLIPNQIAPLPPHHHADGAVALLAAGDSLLVLVAVEPSLAARITASLLGRTPPWVDDTQPVPPLIQAATGAFLAAVARRTSAAQSGLAPPLRLRDVGGSASRALSAASRCTGVLIDATALVGDDAFSISAVVAARPRPTAGLPPFTLDTLRALGDMPLSLPIVASCAEATRQDIEQLGPGQAWMPGATWTVRADPQGLCGPVLLAGSRGELALPANLHADGRIVVGKGVMHVDVDPRANDANEASESPNAADESVATAADVVADVPVVVRVEVGTVTLSAREWAALQPGDVITTGVRVAERAVLRVAGVEVAQGELVDIDGELGVRIHALSGRGGVP